MASFSLKVARCYGFLVEPVVRLVVQTCTTNPQQIEPTVFEPTAAIKANSHHRRHETVECRRVGGVNWALADTARA